MKAACAQSGVALISALLVAALVTLVAVSLMEHAGFSLTGIRNRHDYAQANALTIAGVDYARAVLVEDARTSNIDHVQEAWATPMAPMTTEEGEIGGAIEDLQGRWNLNNLVRADGSQDDEAVAVYRRLLKSLGLAEGLAHALVSWMRLTAGDQRSVPSGKAYKTVRMLADPAALSQVPGYDPQSLARLRPYVAALAGSQAVNINTAPALVVAAVFPPMGLDTAHAMVQDRQRVPCRDVADCIARYPAKEGIVGSTVPLSVSSQHFSVRVDAHVGDIRISRQALIKRTGSSWPELIDTRTIAQ